MMILLAQARLPGHDFVTVASTDRRQVSFGWRRACEEAWSRGDMKSQFRGWTSWVIDVLKSPTAGMTWSFSRPFAVLQNVAFKDSLKAFTICL